MISTFFAADALNTPAGFLMALLVGLIFGVGLERAGFGSSRKLTGIFYFEDMAVLKVIFSAMLTAAIGLALFSRLGLVDTETVYFLPTIYGAQIVGGAIFGIGFAMAGWCPGTAAVGLASGKLDALIFLVGAVLGSALFNEVYGLIEPLYNLGRAGVVTVHDQIGLNREYLLAGLAVLGVVLFYAAEYIEKKRAVGGKLLASPFLATYSLILLGLAGVIVTLPGSGLLPPAACPAVAAAQPAASAPQSAPSAAPESLLASVASAADHMEPEDLAQRLVSRQRGLLLVDVRPAAEYQAFHIRGAINIPLPELEEKLAPYKNKGLVVLYSNGMTHPAQARDQLAREGYANVYILTDGLKGFMERILRPASLRSGPVSAASKAEIDAWRAYFLAAPRAVRSAQAPTKSRADSRPLVEAGWLAANLDRPDVRVIDVRSQPAYNTGHIPGSVYVSPENLRGVVDGISSMLMPAPDLASQFSRIGIGPDDTVVLVTADKPRDATLVGMGLEKLRHPDYALLDAGMGQWVKENLPLTTELPSIAEADYPIPAVPADFTVSAADVLATLSDGQTIILDVRPRDYYLGEKSDEARAGHIPGALNRPYGEDLTDQEGLVRFKPIPELARAYAQLIPTKDTQVIVHCRTGHQASQTYFVLTRLLNYTNVKYYDAGWSEWASRPELPVVSGAE